MAATLVLVGLLSGCAAKATLHSEVESAAIRSAEDSGAGEIPRASLHLQLAKEELAAATALHESGDEEKAESMLLRAEADAELAIVLSREAAETTEAEAAIERVRALRAENH